ncbi:MAG: hypothetical protein C5B50_03065 [Verrucomicrobia bacterium]|nr:MAG: hypothetical protein C5B50_03065 [Verrucomicrobiota bacterium]
MNVIVNYGGRKYGNDNTAENYTIDLWLNQSTDRLRAAWLNQSNWRRKAAQFPHNSDRIVLEYTFDGPHGGRSEYWVMGTRSVYGATLRMSVKEAKELARLLLGSIRQAKIRKGPVRQTFRPKNLAV